MKTFLVATDLSERSDRAVRRAIRIAREHDGRCIVLHVFDDDMPSSLAPRMRVKSEIELNRFVDSEKGDVDVTARVVSGDPLTVIPDVAREEDVDLVVLGLHRKRRILDQLRETTMERLVRLMSRPVLLVRDHADHPYRKILAPVSYSPACATALSAARTLAPDAEIASFHAIYLPFTGLTGEKPGGPMDRELTAEAEAQRKDWCDAQGLSDELCAVSPVTGSLYELIDAQIEIHHPDLLALGAHTRSGFSPYTLGSFAAQLVRYPPADILLAHP